MTVPPLFPQLVEGYSSIKRPIAGSTLVAVAGSGRQVRAQLWVYPKWEWDLTWEYLPDEQANGVTASDFKTLLGMFLGEAGAFGGFLYQDPNENAVTAQPLGVGDGTTSLFLVVKSFGLGAFKGTEPIGYLTPGSTFVLYKNGVPQVLDTDYTAHFSTPYAFTVEFLPPVPLTGDLITADIAFCYFVHFKDDTLDFENFMFQLWAQKKITLESLRD